MKSLVTLSLSFLASAAVLSRHEILEKRQIMDIPPSALGSKPMAPIYTKELTAKMDSKAKRELVVWGPFKLFAANGTHTKGVGIKLDPNSDSLSSMLSGICQDCMILQANMETSNKLGEKEGLTEGVYTHHFVTLDVGRPQIPNPVSAKCKGRENGGRPNGMSNPSAPRSGLGSMISRPTVSVFVGKGNEEGASVFFAPNSTVKSGFYVSKSDKVFMTAEVVNYKPVDRDIYVSMEYEYVQSPSGAKKPADFFDVGMGSIAIEGCNMIGLAAPPKDKPITYNSTEWRVTSNGYLVNIKPHLHDGAINIKFYRNDQLVCTSEAVYGGDHGTDTASTSEKWETISSYTKCYDPVKIKKGDKLTMTADYDLTKHRLRPVSHTSSMGGGGMSMGKGEAEAMAMGNFIFAVSPDQSSSF